MDISLNAYVKSVDLHTHTYIYTFAYIRIYVVMHVIICVSVCVSNVHAANICMEVTRDTFDKID